MYYCWSPKVASTYYRHCSPSKYLPRLFLSGALSGSGWLPSALTSASCELGSSRGPRRMHAMCSCVGWVLVSGRKLLMLSFLNIKVKKFYLLSCLIIFHNLFCNLAYFKVSTSFILNLLCFHVFIVSFCLINLNVPNYNWKRFIHSSKCKDWDAFIL